MKADAEAEADAQAEAEEAPVSAKPRKTKKTKHSAAWEAKRETGAKSLHEPKSKAKAHGKAGAKKSRPK